MATKGSQASDQEVRICMATMGFQASDKDFAWQPRGSLQHIRTIRTREGQNRNVDHEIGQSVKQQSCPTTRHTSNDHIILNSVAPLLREI